MQPQLARGMFTIGPNLGGVSPLLVAALSWFASRGARVLVGCVTATSTPRDLVSTSVNNTNKLMCISSRAVRAVSR